MGTLFDELHGWIHSSDNALQACLLGFSFGLFVTISVHAACWLFWPLGRRPLRLLAQRGNLRTWLQTSARLYIASMNEFSRIPGPTGSSIPLGSLVVHFFPHTMRPFSTPLEMLTHGNSSVSFRFLLPTLTQGSRARN